MKENIIQFSRNECLNLEGSLNHEWLETNGLGAYSSSTILCCHTRKYHGMFVTPVKDLPGKYVLLSKVEPVLVVKDREFKLGTNKYPGVFFPTGHQYIENFQVGIQPSVSWRVGDVLLKKSMMMVRGWPGILIRFDLVESEKPLILKLKPLLAFRSFHTLIRENMGLAVKVFPEGSKSIKIQPYTDLPPLFMGTSHVSRFYPGPFWNHNLEYWEEHFRGFEYQEDLFCPGQFERKMRAGDSLIFSASTEAVNKTLDNLWKTEESRRTQLFHQNAAPSPALQRLAFKTENFLVDHGANRLSINAGYPWFSEWGRDAMIALPGLTLYAGREKEALKILKTFAAMEKNGVLPNVLDPQHREPSYNTLDASLWFFNAVREYWVRTGDTAGVKPFFRVMERILNSFINGSHPWGRLNEEALIEAGNRGTQLTWMDASVKGRPVTSRHGMAVEINALWLNALYFFGEYSKSANLKTDPVWGDCLARGKDSFRRRFWIEDKGRLADVINEAGTDISFRPNQIFGVALAFSPLTLEEGRRLIKKVENELVTPYGLRSLAPKNPQYRGEYRGTPEERDGAYHQGTVWSWLVGPFTEAYLKVSSNKKTAAAHLKKTFQPLFEDHVRKFGIDGISEIFDGNPPYHPRGCISQAWGVAEVIRAIHLIEEAA